MEFQQNPYFCNIVSKTVSHNNKFLKRGLAFVLLFLFTLSITPKKILHDLVTNHQDKTSVINDDSPYSQISNSGYKCNTENLVAESPFAPHNHLIELGTLPIFGTFHASLQQLQLTTSVIFSGLRGPPAFC